MVANLSAAVLIQRDLLVDLMFLVINRSGLVIYIMAVTLRFASTSQGGGEKERRTGEVSWARRRTRADIVGMKEKRRQRS